MRMNGDKRGRKARLKLDLVMELRVIDDAVHTPIGMRAQALAWLCRWRRRPDRVFWEIQPTGGRRLV
jgi:hypothetical protein